MPLYNKKSRFVYMARILTGIQSTGRPHLGNILGAIIPAIKLANQAENDSFLFIADLHSLTQIKDPKELKNNTFEVAATWLAYVVLTQKKQHFTVNPMYRNVLNLLGI